MKRDEAIYLLKLIAFAVGVLLVTFPLWWPILQRDLRWIVEFWK